MDCYKYKKLFIIINKLKNLFLLNLKKIQNKLFLKKKVIKINSFFYKYNFFIYYLKKIGFFLNNKMKFKKFFVFFLFQKRLKKKKRLYKYVKRKKYKSFAVMRKFFKKWWFFFRRRKKKAGRKKKLDFWFGSFLFFKSKNHIKTNKNIKYLDKTISKIYNYDFFLTMYDLKLNFYMDTFFIVEKTDELYTLKLNTFMFDYNKFFNIENQYFIPFLQECKGNIKYTKKNHILKNLYIYNIFYNLTINYTNNDNNYLIKINNIKHKLNNW